MKNNQNTNTMHYLYTIMNFKNSPTAVFSNHLFTNSHNFFLSNERE